MDILIQKDNILLNTKINSKDELFKMAANLLEKSGFIDDKNQFVDDLYKREETMETGLIDGFAIPHAQSRAVLSPTAAYIRTESIIDYTSLDESDIKHVFVLAIPYEANDMHLNMLSTLSRKLMNDEYRKTIKNSNDVKELYELINEEE